MSQSLPGQQQHEQHVDVKKENAAKGEDEDDAGYNVDDDGEEERIPNLKDIEPTEDVMKLEALVTMMDPVIFCHYYNSVCLNLDLVFFNLGSKTLNHILSLLIYFNLNYEMVCVILVY